MTRPHLSYSQLTQWRLCPSRSYFQKVLGLTEPGSWATEYGGLVHDQLESYLIDRTVPEDPRARQAALDNLAGLPTPAAIEAEYRIPIEGTDYDFLCRIDWHNADSVLDHKTKGSFDYIVSQHQLGHDVQLLLYTHAIQVTTGTEIKRIGHHYIQSKGPFASYIEWAPVDQYRVETTWADAVKDFREIIIDRQGPLSEVSRNTRACQAFGRPCPFIVQCDETHAFGD